MHEAGRRPPGFRADSGAFLMGQLTVGITCTSGVEVAAFPVPYHPDTLTAALKADAPVLGKYRAVIRSALVLPLAAAGLIEGAGFRQVGSLLERF